MIDAKLKTKNYGPFIDGFHLHQDLCNYQDHASLIIAF